MIMIMINYSYLYLLLLLFIINSLFLLSFIEYSFILLAVKQTCSLS